MTRLILALLMLAVAVLAFQVVADAVRPRRAAPVSRRSMEVQMPDAVHKIAYVLLILLAFGVTSGWLGGAG